MINIPVLIVLIMSLVAWVNDPEAFSPEKNRSQFIGLALIIGLLTWGLLW